MEEAWSGLVYMVQCWNVRRHEWMPIPEWRSPHLKHLSWATRWQSKGPLSRMDGTCRASDTSWSATGTHLLAKCRPSLPRLLQMKSEGWVLADNSMQEVCLCVAASARRPSSTFLLVGL